MYGSLPLVEFPSAEILVVVVCGVVEPCVADAVVGHGLCKLSEVGIAFKRLFFCVVESVVAHVLLLPCACCGGECIGLGGLDRYFTPLCGCKTAGAVYRHTAFVEFLSVAQYVLAHFTEVEVQVASKIRCVGAFASVDERVEEPEFHIFYICRLEVVGVELTHHASPFAVRVGKCSVGVHLCGEVIRTAFGGIVGEVEYGECGSGSVVSALVAVGIKLAHVYLSYIVV